MLNNQIAKYSNILLPLNVCFLLDGSPIGSIPDEIGLLTNLREFNFGTRIAYLEIVGTMFESILFTESKLTYLSVYHDLLDP